MPIQKQQFRNNLDGYVGAVVIGPRGDDRGVAVEPGGSVWLSEEEQVLTANAPRRPEDNPFVEQTFIVTDQATGELREHKVTPLTPADEGRFVPAELRFVPGTGAPATSVAQAQLDATGDKPVVSTTAEIGAVQRHEEVKSMGEDARPNQPPAIPRAAAQAAAAATAAEASSEETAAAVDPAVGEETGAAAQPSGEPTPGSFTASEEVGTPDAPQPPPFTPPKE